MFLSFSKLDCKLLFLVPPLDLKHIMSNTFFASIFEHLTIHCQRLKAALVLCLKEIIFSFEDCYLISKQGLLLPISIILMRPKS